ncbi:hypothetical protein BDB00DRAFT_812909 [Zychaea mexicana]|uniref:uncharacterized protein n=1 Tax=Zychaea mexicana TaxID=64656 RepID=UPI0022FF1422|nr:uncharacterized protein BDB00DRAFT_812909 [Zychaea mexicana]KAI9495668.1 hypothetical protein BDB00DRAFT_812909 [Zychaea mexicana]
MSGKHTDLGGFEMNPTIVDTVAYLPHRDDDDDINEPCITIPLSDELYSYTEFRGPDVISQGDLELIGNCSRNAYCDKATQTCQPKRTVGEPCENNMECFYGLDIPGHCVNNSICAARDDLPPYYGAALHQWTLGDQWQSAVWAVVATGAIVIFLVVGRQQLGPLVHSVHRLYENWKQPSPQQQERWWNLGWVYKRFNRNARSNDEAYYPLTDRSAEEPPAYRE